MDYVRRKTHWPRHKNHLRLRRAVKKMQQYGLEDAVAAPDLMV